MPKSRPHPATTTATTTAAGSVWLDAQCPRCGGAFECGVNAGHCACFGLRLTHTLRAELATRYSGCLCLRCLGELVEQATRGSDNAAVAPPP